MRIGFIGTGAITSAIVSGLCTTPRQEWSIWVSQRNLEKSALLKMRFPQVTIGQSNQDVVDNVSVVVLAFLPKDRDSLLGSLQFRDEQMIVNLLSGTKNSAVAAQVNTQCTVVRAVPLPCVAEHIGPILIYPDNAKINSLFSSLGRVISVETEADLEHLSVITALMAPYFEMLANITDWAIEVGIDQKQATDFTASMFEALSILARKYPGGDLHQLADESMTPGGLNELARKTIRQYGGYHYLRPALQAVMDRMESLRTRQEEQEEK